MSLSVLNTLYESTLIALPSVLVKPAIITDFSPVVGATELIKFVNPAVPVCTGVPIESTWAVFAESGAANAEEFSNAPVTTGSSFGIMVCVGILIAIVFSSYSRISAN